MSSWEILADILFVLVFVLLNGFFVAAEFAIVKVRMTQLEPLAQKGNLRARISQHILIHTTAYLSAAQLGVTMTSLALGWIGEPIVASMLHPLFAFVSVSDPHIISVVSFAVAFSIITAVHIVVGEQAPKVLAIQKPVAAILAVAYPFRLFYLVFKPIIILLNAASNGLLRLAGLRLSSASDLEHSEAELRLLLSKDKHVSAVSKQIALNAIDFHLKQARHVMVPRKEMIALSATAPAAESITVMRSHKFSRYPVYKDTVDNVIGIVVTKDIFKQDRHLQPGFTVASVIRDAVFLPETATLEKTLETFLQKKTHMLILADEYGGTAGLVTLENVLEELVGTIQDEFDRETPEVVRISDDEYIVDGSVTTNDVERMMNTELSPMDIRSIGGFIIEQLGHIPRVGETLHASNLALTTEKVVENAVETVRIRRIVPPPDEDHAADVS